MIKLFKDNIKYILQSIGVLLSVLVSFYIDSIRVENQNALYKNELVKDLQSIIANERTQIKNIEDEFGSEISKLVDGVTKLSKLDLKFGFAQAENFRKLLLASSDDIRVLLVKLADRLHNIRTINGIKNCA